MGCAAESGQVTGLRQYPMNVNLEGRECIVLGGGHVALRKVRSLLETGAAVTVIAPTLAEALQEMAGEGRVDWRAETYAPGRLPKGFLLICATDDEAVNRAAAAEAKEQGMLVNAPAQPELSDFTVPASLRRGSLLLTVSTEQLSPACARLIRRYLEQEFPESFGKWLEDLARLREEVKCTLPDSAARERFWRQVMDEDLLKLAMAGDLEQAEVRIRNAVDRNRVEL